MDQSARQRGRGSGIGIDRRGRGRSIGDAHCDTRCFRQRRARLSLHSARLEGSPRPAGRGRGRQRTRGFITRWQWPDDRGLRRFAAAVRDLWLEFDGLVFHYGAPLGYDNLLVSGARSTGYQHFPGFGWRLLIVEPTASAFAPIWQLLGAMLVVLLFTLAVALWIASRLADRITRPIIALTDSTRRYRRGERAVPFTSSAGMIEVGELSQAFGEMIGALERSREQIVRAGKLAVVGEMAAIMVHEVRTPLGILRSSAQLLGRQAQLDDKGRELIGFIVSETDRLNRLVTLLLETASPRAPDFLPHDLNEIIDHVLALLAAKAENKGVQLQRELTPQGTTLVCDREQIIQVFLNLVINALHFVPAGGRIKISTCAEDGMLVASVADDGPGIPAELRARIFDPFFTRREGGIGLGLTIVQQIVQAHHAEIDAAESEWGGASFRVRFDTRRGDANGSA